MISGSASVLDGDLAENDPMDEDKEHTVIIVEDCRAWVPGNSGSQGEPRRFEERVPAQCSRSLARETACGMICADTKGEDSVANKALSSQKKATKARNLV